MPDPVPQIDDVSENWLQILRWTRRRTGKAEPTKQEVRETAEMWRAGERPPVPSFAEIYAEELRRDEENGRL